MSRILIIFGLLLARQLIKTNAKVTYFSFDCENFSNTSTKTLEERNRLLYNIFQINVYRQASVVKFYNATFWDDPRKVYVLFQCRDDLSLANCAACVREATQKIFSSCPFYNEAVVWYEECMLRFSFRNIFSLVETNQWAREWSNTYISNYPVLTEAMDSVIKATGATGTNGTHFAAKEVNLTSAEKLYSFAQCTPDIGGSECLNCLKVALTLISKHCNASGYVMIFLASCQLRYDTKPILERDASLAPPPFTFPLPKEGIPGPSHSTLPTRKKLSFTATIIVVVLSCLNFFGFVLLMAALWLCLCYETNTKSLDQSSRSIEGLQHDGSCGMRDISNMESVQFDFKSIQASTSNFSWGNKLGKGGFGEVFKGKFTNGIEIAVKRLLKNTQHGASHFKNEVILLAKLQHRNLVKLLGFAISGEEKLLIYEFLSNSSLDRFLYDPLKRASLDWELRFKIISGVARGLLYLHEDSRLKIIHRDLKASNILLDEAMNAKIADFGLAKIFDFDQSQDDTKRIAGTYGYMAPEYALAGRFSVKSDVYSFGVIVLEIISGKRNRFFHRETDEGLLHRAWRCWNDNAILDLVDPLLDHKYCEDEMRLCIQISLLCIQEDAIERPRMALIVSALNGQSITLPSPNAPHFFTIGVVTDQPSSSNPHLLPVIDPLHRNLDHDYVEHTGTTNITEVYPR